MSDDKRLDELEKTVSQLVRDDEARKKEKKVSERNRKLWLMISLVLVVSAVIISFTVSCDMSSLLSDIDINGKTNIKTAANKIAIIVINESPITFILLIITLLYCTSMVVDNMI